MGADHGNVDVVLLGVVTNHLVNGPFSNHGEVLDPGFTDHLGLLVQLLLRVI